MGRPDTLYATLTRIDLIYQILKLQMANLQKRREYRNIGPIKIMIMIMNNYDITIPE